MGETPSKYVPEKRDWEKKHWLQEKYWGEFRSAEMIADEAGVAKVTILEQLRDFGIPRRCDGFTENNTVSPFAGFYTEDEVAQASDTTPSPYDPDYGDETEAVNLDWQKSARREEHISDKAVIKDE